MNEFKDIPLSEFSETESASESTSVEKIPEYVPTQWVDETEPDIDADHLNHIEDGIKKVTDGVNNIIENGGGSFVPSDGYVYIDQEESEENPDPVDVPLLDADTFGGQLPSYYAPQHEISDAFSEGKNYAAGDYCIFSNTLHRFTSAKPAGAWDGTKAVPVTVMGEMRRIEKGVDISDQIIKAHSDDIFIARKFGNIVEIWGIFGGSSRTVLSGEKIADIPEIIRPTHTVTGTGRGANDIFGLAVVSKEGSVYIHFNPANSQSWYDCYVIYAI